MSEAKTEHSSSAIALGQDIGKARLEVARGTVDMPLFICGGANGCAAFVTGYLDAIDSYPPRFCPSCGRKFGSLP